MALQRNQTRQDKTILLSVFREMSFVFHFLCLLLFFLFSYLCQFVLYVFIVLQLYSLPLLFYLVVIKPKDPKQYNYLHMNFRIICSHEIQTWCRSVTDTMFFSPSGRETKLQLYVRACIYCISFIAPRVLRTRFQPFAKKIGSLRLFLKLNLARESCT